MNLWHIKEIRMKWKKNEMGFLESLEGALEFNLS